MAKNNTNLAELETALCNATNDLNVDSSLWKRKVGKGEGRTTYTLNLPRDELGNTRVLKLYINDDKESERYNGFAIQLGDMEEYLCDAHYNMNTGILVLGRDYGCGFEEEYLIRIRPLER